MKTGKPQSPDSLHRLAAIIARAIFVAGDEPGSPCKRIQFKGGKWPDNERNQGGIGEAPLVALIAAQLEAYNDREDSPLQPTDDGRVCSNALVRRRRLCPECEGRGEIVNRIFMDDKYDEPMTCPTCKGNRTVVV